MAKLADAPLLTQEQIEEVASFEGFMPQDFEVFEIPGFEARMPALRARIKPKLITLGQHLAPRLTEALGETLYPHVAQHLRRTVNAPEETWVAFARTARGYKPVVHLRVAVSAKKARITVFVEDYADDKALFAANLGRNADALSAYLWRHPTIRAYEILDEAGEPKIGDALKAETLRAFADRMDRVKGQHAVFGIAFDRAHPILAKGPEFADAVMEAARTLQPLYNCGKTADYHYTYEPEPIAGL